MNVIVYGFLIGFVILFIWFLLALFLEWLDKDGVWKTQQRLKKALKIGEYSNLKDKDNSQHKEG